MKVQKMISADSEDVVYLESKKIGASETFRKGVTCARENHHAIIQELQSRVRKLSELLDERKKES